MLECLPPVCIIPIKENQTGALSDRLFGMMGLVATCADRERGGSNSGKFFDWLFNLID